MHFVIYFYDIIVITYFVIFIIVYYIGYCNAFLSFPRATCSTQYDIA